MSELVLRYQSIREEFDRLLAHGIEVANALAGKDATKDRESYADRIFSKLICHGVTLQRISPSALRTASAELWDISSSCAVARALIESFDALAYIAVEPVQEYEREFRTLLWKLHAEERRQKMFALIGSTLPQVVEVDAAVLSLRGALLAHPFLRSYSAGISKKLAKGTTPPFHLDHAERNRRSGVNHDYYKVAVMFLSAYVHTFPFSIHQLIEFRAGNDESLRLMAMPLQYASGFLAKGIDGMHSVFPSLLPLPNETTQQAIDTWTTILRDGIRHLG